MFSLIQLPQSQFRRHQILYVRRAQLDFLKKIYSEYLYQPCEVGIAVALGRFSRSRSFRAILATTVSIRAR